MATQKVERTLAQGEPSEAALASIQHELEQETEQPLLLLAARGERAEVDQRMQAIVNGDLDRARWFTVRAGPDGYGNSCMLLAPKGTRAALLKSNTALVEIAKLPVEQQIVPSKHCRQARSRIPAVFIESTLARMRENLVEQFHRDQADLRCAVVMVAVERYRQANNRWPGADGPGACLPLESAARSLRCYPVTLSP